MGKKHAPPPGLDYAPVSGDNENLSFGVAQADGDGTGPLSLEQFVGKRLYPVRKPKDYSRPWERITCFKSDVLVPTGASDELWDAQRLCRAYDQQCFDGIRDLAVIVTLRFPQVEAVPQTMRLAEAWDLARSFALERLVKDRALAVIAIMHVPARAARPGFPHVHLIAPARQLLPSGFGMFAQPLASDEGRALMDAEWREWAGGSRS
jgi:hypothetical protein